MKLVYHASNSVEAHIIKGLFLQHDIQAHISGEYLQGGIGELHMNDLVSVWVEDHDVAQAQTLIETYNNGDNST